MHFNAAHKNSLRVLIPVAAGLIFLACAGTGLAAVLNPDPADTPDSTFHETARVLGFLPVALTPPPHTAPIPPLKPRHPDSDMDAMAAAMTLLEPASFTPVAVPPEKPAPPLKTGDSSLSAITNLLRFGQPDARQQANQPEKPRNLSPLSAQDAGLYRQIFAAQALGDWKTADAAMERLGDLRLRGHVLYQRYMHPAYKARFAELQAWMDLYNDLPGADKIYNLALRRRPKGAHHGDNHVKKPRNQIGLSAGGTLNILSTAGDTYESSNHLTHAQKRDIARLVRAVHADISRGNPAHGLKRLTQNPNAKRMDPVEYDQLRAQISSALLLLGKPAKAKTLAMASAARSGAKAPLAGWTGGLAAWREKDYASAAGLFEQVARSPYASTWMNAAGAYWASRSYLRAGQPQKVTYWLKEAAGHPRTFYGLIATRALGWDFDFDWSIPKFTQADFNTLVKIPAAWRAMALVQAGQSHLAEAELMQIDTSAAPALKTAILAYAQQVNLPSLAMRIASNTKRPDGKLYDAALYPLLPWQPKGGYSVDRALIFAIIRQESKFDTWAESASGATGLMQLMPATASYIAGTRDFTDKAGRYALKNPEINIGIGQKYIERLLSRDGVNNDLMALAIAYNAGPGNLRKWQHALSDVSDPLLFIEMIPMAETRNYVEKVLANYWIYNMRMNEPLPSLDSVAEGKWAQYTPLEDHTNPVVRLGFSGAAKAFRVADSRP